MIKMTTWRTTSIAALVLLITFLLVAITVTSVVTEETTNTTTEYNYEEITEEVIKEITSYIQIKDQKGKYTNINGEQKINKIAILISPLVSQNIELPQLTIQLDNGETIRILTYYKSSKLSQQSIFEHNIWNSINGTNYGLITICDTDNSITDYNLINENSDNAYLVFKLPSDMTMNKHDKLIVTLFPASGITKTIILKAPLPIKPIVTFE